MAERLVTENDSDVRYMTATCRLTGPGGVIVVNQRDRGLYEGQGYTMHEDQSGTIGHVPEVPAEPTEPDEAEPDEAETVKE